MINYAYSQRNQYNSTPIITFLCFVVFFDLTAFFFLTFMNICFETIVSSPPIWILIILYLVMGFDMVAGVYTSMKMTKKFFLDLAILILLILSWSTTIKVFLYLSALVFLRFPQTLKFNQIMQNKARSNGNLFVLYTLLKILYLFAIIGHIFGCIFYAIDNALIQAKRYGSIYQNPGSYYQGELLCYSPIYSLSEINKYVYAMYYIFSLLSTVAYGDIIPKNPFQNAYVCFLLVFSTISIGYVIEQLLIVLRNNWDTINTIIRKMIFLDSMLLNSVTVKEQSRLTLVNFMVYSLRHEAFNRPKFQRLTSNLSYRLRGQSIFMKKQQVDPNSLEGMDKIINMKIYEQFSVPRFLAIFLLPLLEQVYYPGNYEIINNQNVRDTNSLFIILSGSLKLGYGQKYHFKSIINERGTILCWKQFIWANKNLNKSFKVQTCQLSQFYTISTDTFRNILKQEKKKSLSDDNFSKILESYHIEKNIQLTKAYEDNTYYQNLERVVEILNAPKFKTDELQSQILGCWGCGKKTHMPVNCPIFHYKPDFKILLESEDRIIKRRRRASRRGLRSQKIKVNDRKKKDQKFSLKQFLKNKDKQLQNLKILYYRQMPVIFERYESYESFYLQFNLKSNNFGIS